ncbi:hypothetical protein HPP92_013905 [Vanilla planifolia]|uniref:Uncharacterized protein n=1 Tax=Vanilla planifolia TaxID=51239 RepID=A0A835V123_VANPL|nr:hypothetical protein HPP92_013905 [Vanilla planifolia]
MAMITHFGIFDSRCLALDIRGNAVGDAEVDDVEPPMRCGPPLESLGDGPVRVKCANLVGGGARGM